jgi:hypothetical protein
MANERLSLDAIKRVSGPAWESLRPLFFEVSDLLLDTNSNCVGVLTTIYVKYQVSSEPSSAVFAVVWLKTSSQIVIGLALPDQINSSLLGPPPKGMTYKGLTKYLTLKPGESLPAELPMWAAAAYRKASVSQE